MSTQEEAAVAEKIVTALAEAHTLGRRGLVIVRCGGPNQVDRARDTLSRMRAPFSWRSLPVAELDPPDLLGFAIHAGKPEGPAFLAYGLPKRRDGQIDPDLCDYLVQRTRDYVERATLMVLILTLQEMKAVSALAREFWAARDTFVAWPGGEDAARFVPARMGGGVAAQRSAGLASQRAGGIQAQAAGGVQAQAAGGIADVFASGMAAPGVSDIVQSPDNTPWAGAPFAREDQTAPEYYKNSPAPAGRRWGKELCPIDPEGGVIIDEARQLLDARQTEIARAELAKAAKRFRKNQNPAAAAECYVLLGRCAEQRIDHAVAYDWFKAALDVYDQLDDTAGYSDCASYIGYLRFLHGDGDGARQCFALALERDVLARDELRMAAGHRRLGVLSERKGEGDEALKKYESARDLEEKNQDKRAQSRSLTHLARLYRQLNRGDDAAKLLQQSIDLKAELEDEPGLASSYHELGNLLYQKGSLDEALDAYEKALDIEVRMRDLPGIAATQAQIGLVQKDRFVFSGAVRAMLIARELFRRLNSPHAEAISKALDGPAGMVDRMDIAELEVEVNEWIDDLVYGEG